MPLQENFRDWVLRYVCNAAADPKQHVRKHRTAWARVRVLWHAQKTGRYSDKLLTSSCVALGYSCQSQSLVQTLAARDRPGLSLTASARNLAIVKFGKRRRAAAQTSPQNPLQGFEVLVAQMRQIRL